MLKWTKFIQKRNVELLGYASIAIHVKSPTTYNHKATLWPKSCENWHLPTQTKNLNYANSSSTHLMYNTKTSFSTNTIHVPTQLETSKIKQFGALSKAIFTA